MKKYMKKPLVIQACEIPHPMESLNYMEDMLALLDWMREHGVKFSYKANRDGATEVFVETLEGQMRGKSGDFIIRGIKGEFYPCAGEIFRDSYQEA